MASVSGEYKKECEFKGYLLILAMAVTPISKSTYKEKITCKPEDAACQGRYLELYLRQ